MSVSDLIYKKKHYTTAIVVAGGSGSRMKSEKTKQFMELCGEPVIARTLDAFEKCDIIRDVIVVSRVDEVPLYDDLCKKYGFKKVSKVVAGGKTRQESVLKGFEAIGPKTKFVAIHDGARPLVTPEIIEKVAQKAYLTKAAAAASPCKDTPKIIDPISKTVKNGVDRDTLWLIETPQIFYADLYRCSAYYAKEKGFTGTDDASLAEYAGFEVTLVESGDVNLKLTTPEDLLYAEVVLRKRNISDVK